VREWSQLNSPTPPIRAEPALVTPRVISYDNEVRPPDEETSGQLLRALASNAIRGALEGRFGVVLAFRCVRPGMVGGAQYCGFVSIEGQVLNQQPGFVDC
jgi:hypothetical protein